MNLEARTVSRRIAKNIEGMPYREAVFLVDRALDFIHMQLDGQAPEFVVEDAYHEYEEWVAELDANSRQVIKLVDYSVMVGYVEQRRKERAAEERIKEFTLKLRRDPEL